MASNFCNQNAPELETSHARNCKCSSAWCSITITGSSPSALAAQRLGPTLQVLAEVLGAEAAIGRIQFVSGTHAIATALYSVLRPGDELLAVAGRHVRTSSCSLCIFVFVHGCVAHCQQTVLWLASLSVWLLCIVHLALLVLYMHDSKSHAIIATQLRQCKPRQPFANLAQQKLFCVYSCCLDRGVALSFSLGMHPCSNLLLHSV